MFYFPPTIILRHRRENVKKCSLRGTDHRKDFVFFTYPEAVLPDLTHYCILHLDGPPLTTADRHLGLLLIDGTWKHARVMDKIIPTHVARRSLPPTHKTAYPRRQPDCPDPQRGLASIEALYLAYLILERETEGILDHYYWKELFIHAYNGAESTV